MHKSAWSISDSVKTGWAAEAQCQTDRVPGERVDRRTGAGMRHSDDLIVTRRCHASCHPPSSLPASFHPPSSLHPRASISHPLIVMSHCCHCHAATALTAAVPVTLATANQL